MGTHKSSSMVWQQTHISLPHISLVGLHRSSISWVHSMRLLFCIYTMRRTRLKICYQNRGWMIYMVTSITHTWKVGQSWIREHFPYLSLFLVCVIPLSHICFLPASRCHNLQLFVWIYGDFSYDYYRVMLEVMYHFLADSLSWMDTLNMEGFLVSFSLFDRNILNILA